MDTKRIALAILAVLAILQGVATQYPDPYNPSELVSVLLTIIFAAAVFVWYRADAIARAYGRSPVLNFAVFGLAALALPYYFFRSRGWKHGFIATIAAFGVFLAICLLSSISAMATAWAMFPAAA